MSEIHLGKTGVVRHSIRNPGSKTTFAYYRVYLPDDGFERTFKGNNLAWIPDPNDTRPRWGGGVYQPGNISESEKADRRTRLTPSQFEAFEKSYEWAKE